MFRNGSPANDTDVVQIVFLEQPQQFSNLAIVWGVAAYPDYIHILEDLNAEKAVPILKQIADSKSRLASLAKKVADRIIENNKENEEENQKPAKAKS